MMGQCKTSGRGLIDFEHVRNDIGLLIGLSEPALSAAIVVRIRSNRSLRFFPCLVDRNSSPLNGGPLPPQLRSPL
jgi:hypothetical protein